MTPERTLATLRSICLGFPEAEERETGGEATFRVRDRIFVIAGVREDGTVGTSMKAYDEQEALLARGAPFYHPPYVGSKRWIGIELGDDTDWDEMAELVEESYRSTAPKRLVRELDEQR